MRIYVTCLLVVVCALRVEAFADRGPGSGHGEKVESKCDDKGDKSDKSSKDTYERSGSFGKDLSTTSQNDDKRDYSTSTTKAEPIGEGTYGWDLIFSPEFEAVLNSGNPLLMGGWAEYYLYARNFYLDMEASVDHTIHNGDDTFVDLETYLLIGSGNHADGFRKLPGFLLSFVGSFCSWGEPDKEKVWFKYLDVALGYGFQSHRLHGNRHELLVGGVIGYAAALVDSTDTAHGLFIGPHLKILNQFNRWFGIRFTSGFFIGVLNEHLLVDIHARVLGSIYLLHNNLYLELGPQLKYYTGGMPLFEYGDAVYRWVLDEPSPDFAFIVRMAFNLNFTERDASVDSQ